MIDEKTFVDLQTLKVLLEARNPERYMAQISASMPWIIDYKNRKHVYVYSAIALNLVSTDIGTIPLPPNTWWLIDLPEGLRITASGQVTPVYMYVQATDEVLSPNPPGNVTISGQPIAENITQVGGTPTGLSLPIFDYPAGAVPVAATSGNQANATATATLPAAVGKTTYIAGFDITSDGATAVSIVLATIANLIGAVTFSYVYTAVAGATTQDLTITRTFSKPIPASGANTAIPVSLPALGAGNTNAVVNAHGYQL